MIGFAAFISVRQNLSLDEEAFRDASTEEVGVGVGGGLVWLLLLVDGSTIGALRTPTRVGATVVDGGERGVLTDISIFSLLRGELEGAVMAV